MEVNQERGGMLLEIKGTQRPTHISVSECKAAVQFAANKLFSSKLQDRLQISLWFSTKETADNDWFGYCNPERNTFKPREFEIAVDPGLTRYYLLRTIFHEMAHVEQYARGRLKEYVRMSGVIGWEGKHYKDKREERTNTPWEKEARSLELRLYKQFKEYVKDTV